MSDLKAIRFYFDYISPNAYLAWMRIGALAGRHGRAIEPVPVLYAAMLNAHGQLGPAEIPPKRAWMWRNVSRKAMLLGLPLRPPRTHPFNPLLALRVTSLEMDQPARSRLIDALFAAVWVDCRDVSEAREVVALASGVGLDGERMVQLAGEPEAKQRLSDTTGEAIESGVFGVPTMAVGGELFWGYDDFPHLERFLSGDDPLDRSGEEAWARVKPSADRRGKR